MKSSKGAAKWAVIIVLSVVLGIALVQYLVAPPLFMAAYLLLCVVLAAGLALIVFVALRGRARVLAIGVVLAGFLVGYLATTMAFLNLEEERHLAELNLPPAELRDHAAVIYFTHGEPPAYSPMPWIETFKELDADKVSFIPKPFRPFFFLKFREEYLKVGGSPHNYIHQDMAGSLREAFQAEGDNTTRFYMAFLDSDPRPDEAVIRALNEGANKVAFATVFVTVSSHTKAGQDMVKELDLDKYGVPICFSEPLWDSDNFARDVRGSSKRASQRDGQGEGWDITGRSRPAGRLGQGLPDPDGTGDPLPPVHRRSSDGRWIRQREHLAGMDGVQATGDPCGGAGTGGKRC